LPMDTTVAGDALDVNARMVRRPGGGGGGGHDESSGTATTGGSGDTHVEGYRDSPY